jgi:hypothetical protein
MHAEVKVTVDKASLPALRAALGPTERVEREVTFYDTPDRVLFGRGIIVRSRFAKGKKDDVSVKIRGVAADIALPVGAELELDATADMRVWTLGVSREVDGDDAKAVASGALPIARLLSVEQQALLAGTDLSLLLPIGPIATTLEKANAPSGLPGPVTLEVWRIDEDDVVELSLRCPESEVATTRVTILESLARVGVRLSGVQQTKTERVLRRGRTPSSSRELH